MVPLTVPRGSCDVESLHFVFRDFLAGKGGLLGGARRRRGDGTTDVVDGVPTSDIVVSTKTDQIQVRGWVEDWMVIRLNPSPLRVQTQRVVAYPGSK